MSPAATTHASPSDATAQPGSRSAPQAAAPFLSSAPIDRGQRRLALGAIGLSVAIFVALAPFARQPLTPIWPFIPIYQSALATSDLITAAILFIQFNILRSRALLVLAAGYLFAALMAAVHALTFPGLFAPGGLLGAGPQTTAWLYMFWHAGFPLAVIAYALLARPDDSARQGEKQTPVRPALLLAIAATAGAVIALTFLATAGKANLPNIMVGNNYTPAMITVVSAVWAVSLVGLAVLWLRRPHTLLDLWLMVVMCAWLFDIALSAVLNAGRFDLGFYAGRAYGFVAAISVLVILLMETGTLYAQLAKLYAVEQQERRREAEERSRIVETSLDLILVTDRQGTLLRISPSMTAILGYDPADMGGHAISGIVHPDDLAAIGSAMEHARRGHVIRDFATRCRHKDGRLVTLAWSGVWSEPEQRHFFIGRDVTEHTRVERMKDEFIATVSHELRTPVTSIAGPLRLLIGGAAGELAPPAKRLVAIATINSERLTRLVNDILDFEKIEAGTMPFALQRVEAKPLVADAIEANRALADGFGVDVRLDEDAPDAAVRADEQRLRQVMAHLLSNAVKFSPPGEDVTVSIEAHGETIRIAVRDRGPGIPAEFKALIFEKFAQADATDARRKGGTGLGLSLVKQAMTRMGGRVGLENAPSGGTIVHLDLPRWNADLLVERTPQLSGDAQVIRLQPDDEKLRGLEAFRRA